MKKLLWKKRITTVLFLVFIFIFSIINARKELPILVENIQTFDFKEFGINDLISQINTTINENVAGRYGFIDAYGYMQKVLDKHEESNFEVVKDTEGKLHYTYFTDKADDTSEVTGRVHNYAKQIEGKSKLLVVLPPEKYIKGHTQFPTGIPYAMTNETADNYVSQLKAYDIPCLDLREGLLDSGIDLSNAFFTTDHHWKIETAFWAASEFCRWMNNTYGEHIDEDGYYSDLSNYNQITYKNIFLGSMGRKTGRYYAGADDFTLIYPAFPTNYKMTNTIDDSLEYGGRFEEALVATPVLRSSDKPFDTDIYMAYLYGNPAFTHIENLDNEDGLNICLIKDSFAVPFAAFTSLRCHTIDMIDPRYYEGDYVDAVMENDYDYVIVMISPQDLVEEFFPFGVEKD